MSKKTINKLVKLLLENPGWVLSRFLPPIKVVGENTRKELNEKNN